MEHGEFGLFGEGEFAGEFGNSRGELGELLLQEEFLVLGLFEEFAECAGLGFEGVDEGRLLGEVFGLGGRGLGTTGFEGGAVLFNFGLELFVDVEELGHFFCLPLGGGFYL